MTIAYKVFVNHLPAETKFKGLQKYLFERFEKFQLFKSKNRGKNRSSYAVVSVFQESDYQLLLNTPFRINGEVCEVTPFISEEERERMVAEKLSKRVYINNLHDNITKKDLRVIFELYGDIKELYLKENYDEKFETKYAFVTFEEKSSVHKCITSLIEHKYMDQTLVMIDSIRFKEILTERRKKKKLAKENSKNRLLNQLTNNQGSQPSIQKSNDKKKNQNISSKLQSTESGNSTASISSSPQKYDMFGIPFNEKVTLSEISNIDEIRKRHSGYYINRRQFLSNPATGFLQQVQFSRLPKEQFYLQNNHQLSLSGEFFNHFKVAFPGFSKDPHMKRQNYPQQAMPEQFCLY